MLIRSLALAICLYLWFSCAVGSKTLIAEPGATSPTNTGTKAFLSTQGSSLSATGSTLTGGISGLSAIETDLGTAFRLSSDILFDFDKAELKPEATPVLEELLAAIQQKQPKQIQIHGHTDSKGSYSYNLNLSQRRAETVAVWLSQHGVDSHLFSVAGFGESKPIAPNNKPNGEDDPEGRQKNRRVDVLLSNTFSAVKPLSQ